MYKFKCLDCGYEFDKILFYTFTSDCTSGNKHLGLVGCPRCGSYNVITRRR